MGKLKQTTAEVQALLDKVAEGPDAQLDSDSENTIQNKAVTEALNEKASVTYVDERLADVEQGVLAYVDTRINNKVGKVEDDNITYAQADGFTNGEDYYVLPSSPKPNETYAVLATTDYVNTAIANAITNTLNTAV